MTSKLKKLGVGVLATAVISMIAASVAQAGDGEIHVTNTSGLAADLTGEQVTQNVFKLTSSGLETRCTQATFEGTISGQASSEQTTATEGTLTGRYTGCQSQGPFKAAATVDMNGCKYTITGFQVQALTADVDIAGCTSGKKIEITTEGCTIEVPEQAGVGFGLHQIAFSNEGTGETQDVRVTSNIQGINYQTTGVFCVLGTKQHFDGDYTGTATVKAFEDTGQTETKTHNGHVYSALVCGTQKGLFAT